MIKNLIRKPPKKWYRTFQFAMWKRGQLLSKNSILDMISHINRVVRDAPSFGSFDVRQLHETHKNIYDPYRTSEGDVVGLSVDLCANVLIDASGSVDSTHASSIGHVSQHLIFERHMPPVRCMYATNHIRQSVGEYSPFTPMPHRYLAHVQKPIIEPQHAPQLLHGSHFGTNAVVLVGTFHGWNIEDALVVHRRFFENGACHTIHTEHGFIDLDVDEIVTHKPEIGQYIPAHKPLATTSNRRTIEFDRPCTVTKIALTNARIEIHGRSYHLPQIGDKFSTRHGQKGVVSRLVDTADMPYTEDGLVPDIIINPSAFPSRMTVSQLLESLAGRRACELSLKSVVAGKILPRDARLDTDSTQWNDTLTFFDPRTGLPFEKKMHVGLVYYLTSCHSIAKKVRARSSGPRDSLTKQPTQGRSRKGGLRIGEMEYSVMLLRNVHALIRDRTLECSDTSLTNVCLNCNGVDVHRDPRNSNLCVAECCTCTNKHTEVEISYTLRLILLELRVLGVVSRAHLQKDAHGNLYIAWWTFEQTPVDAPLFVLPSHCRVNMVRARGRTYADDLDNMYDEYEKLQRNDADDASDESDIRIKIRTEILRRWSGKNGRWRNNLCGKRCDYILRSVLSPNPRLDLDEVGLPNRLAQNLVIREVYSHVKNKHLVRSIYDARKRRRYDSRFKTPTPHDIVERHIQDGDLVIVNRQPTLRPSNFFAMRVRLIDDTDTVQLHPAVFGCFDADCDGDELNIHVPQSIDARQELSNMTLESEIVGCDDDFTLDIIQDAALGGRILGYFNHKRELQTSFGNAAHSHPRNVIKHMKALYDNACEATFTHGATVGLDLRGVDALIDSGAKGKVEHKRRIRLFRSGVADDDAHFRECQEARLATISTNLKTAESGYIMRKMSYHAADIDLDPEGRCILDDNYWVLSFSKHFKYDGRRRLGLRMVCSIVPSLTQASLDSFHSAAAGQSVSALEENTKIAMKLMDGYLGKSIAAEHGICVYRLWLVEALCKTLPKVKRKWFELLADLITITGRPLGISLTALKQRCMENKRHAPRYELDYIKLCKFGNARNFNGLLQRYTKKQRTHTTY